MKKLFLLITLLFSSLSLTAAEAAADTVSFSDDADDFVIINETSEEKCTRIIDTIKENWKITEPSRGQTKQEHYLSIHLPMIQLHTLLKKETKEFAQELEKSFKEKLKDLHLNSGCVCSLFGIKKMEEFTWNEVKKGADSVTELTDVLKAELPNAKRKRTARFVWALEELMELYENAKKYENSKKQDSHFETTYDNLTCLRKALAALILEDSDSCCQDLTTLTSMITENIVAEVNLIKELLLSTPLYFELFIAFYSEGILGLEKEITKYKREALKKAITVEWIEQKNAELHEEFTAKYGDITE